MPILLTIAWLIAIVYSTIPSYWLVVHPFTQRGGRTSLLRIGPVWLLMWIAAGALTWHWRLLTFYDAGWTWLPGVLLILLGFIFYGAARENFTTDQVLGRSELEPSKHEQRLVTSGIRAQIRHPYYLGHFCELLGWTIATGLVVLYALFGFAIVTGYFMIRAEERELEARFGDAYRQYRVRSAALFPGLW